MKTCRLLVACVVASLPFIPAFAEEGEAKGPKALVDNETVRVMEITMKPGAKTERKDHGDVAAYFLSDAKFKMTAEDGASKDHSFKAGQAAYFPAKNEVCVNTGDADFKVVAVQIKKHGDTAPAGTDPIKAGGDVYSLVFENDRVRIMTVTFKPGGAIPSHVHPSHVAYILEGTKLHIAPAGKTGQDFDIAPGAAMFIGAETHAAHNPDTKTTKAVVFEIKPAK